MRSSDTLGPKPRHCLKKMAATVTSSSNKSSQAGIFEDVCVQQTQNGGGCLLREPPTQIDRAYNLMHGFSECGISGDNKVVGNRMVISCPERSLHYT